MSDPARMMVRMASATDVLERFTPATQDWFRGAFDAPTSAQSGAWEAISGGKHALVVAPTGATGAAGAEAVAATVQRVTRVGFEVRIEVARGDATVLVTATRPQFQALGAGPGDPVWWRPAHGAPHVAAGPWAREPAGTAR